MDLSGKVLVVTGSDGVLGQAVAATLSRYGARLALLEHGQTSAAAQPAGALRIGGIDLTRDDAARSAMERVVKETGRLDGLLRAQRHLIVLCEYALHIAVALEDVLHHGESLGPVEVGRLSSNQLHTRFAGDP